MSFSESRNSTETEVETPAPLPFVGRTQRTWKGGPFVFGVPAVVVPTAITSLSAFCGLVAIKGAMAGAFELPVLLILFAALLDCLDGQTARRLNCTSRFGVELDSLGDFLSFGVAPGFVVYLWSLQGVPIFGFLIVAIYVLCCAYRLARFNASALEPDRERVLPGYFQGVPAPAGAVCALLPLMVAFSTERDWTRDWKINAIGMIVTALLMASTLPTFSSKSILPLISVRAIFFISLAILILFLFFDHWAILIVMALIYAASVPVAVTRARSKRRPINLRDTHGNQ